MSLSQNSHIYIFGICLRNKLSCRIRMQSHISYPNPMGIYVIQYIQAKMHLKYFPHWRVCLYVLLYIIYLCVFVLYFCVWIPQQLSNYSNATSDNACLLTLCAHSSTETYTSGAMTLM